MSDQYQQSTFYILILYHRWFLVSLLKCSVFYVLPKNRNFLDFSLAVHNSCGGFAMQLRSGCLMDI